MRRRSGISLIELLITMSACSIVLTMSAMLIHRVMHVQSRSQQFANVERNAFRLSQALRTDACQAISVNVAAEQLPPNTLLRFTLPDHQVLEYLQQEGSLQRVVRRGDSVLARESFAFPPGTIFSSERDGEQLLVVETKAPAKLPVASESPPAAFTPLRAPLRLRIEAVLSKPVDRAEQQGASS